MGGLTEFDVISYCFTNIMAAKNEIDQWCFLFITASKTPSRNRKTGCQSDLGCRAVEGKQQDFEAMGHGHMVNAWLMHG
jgi:hypothetical protein